MSFFKYAIENKTNALFLNLYYIYIYDCTLSILNCWYMWSLLCNCVKGSLINVEDKERGLFPGPWHLWLNSHWKSGNFFDQYQPLRVGNSQGTLSWH